MATIYFDYMNRGTQTTTSGNDTLVEGAKAILASGSTGSPALTAIGDQKAYDLKGDLTASDMTGSNTVVVGEVNTGVQIDTASASVSASQGTGDSYAVVLLHSDNTTTAAAGATAVDGDRLAVVITSGSAPAACTMTVSVTCSRPV